MTRYTGAAAAETPFYPTGNEGGEIKYFVLKKEFKPCAVLFW